MSETQDPELETSPMLTTTSGESSSYEDAPYRQVRAMDKSTAIRLTRDVIFRDLKRTYPTLSRNERRALAWKLARDHYRAGLVSISITKA